MDLLELQKRIRTIELKTKGLTQQIFSGQSRSSFKGRGMSFSEVRNYTIGDDVRAIDWNVTARFREPYVKIFEEERELTVMLIIDVSGSMYFGEDERSKFLASLEMAATVAFSAAKRNDKVGAIFVSDQVEKFVPAKKGWSHVHYLLNTMVRLKPNTSKTDLNAGFEWLQRVQRSRSLVMVISDFTECGMLKESFQKAQNKHDVIALQLSDRGEEELPNIGFVSMFNAESGKTTWIDTSNLKVRDSYRQMQQKRLHDTQQFFNRLRIDYARIDSHDDVFRSMLHLFQNRK
jgi:uncharacterized protein (DUF58 family)